MTTTCLKTSLVVRILRFFVLQNFSTYFYDCRIFWWWCQPNSPRSNRIQHNLSRGSQDSHSRIFALRWPHERIFGVSWMERHHKRQSQSRSSRLPVFSIHHTVKPKFLQTSRSIITTWTSWSKSYQLMRNFGQSLSQFVNESNQSKFSWKIICLVWRLSSIHSPTCHHWSSFTWATTTTFSSQMTIVKLCCELWKIFRIFLVFIQFAESTQPIKLRKEV